MPAILNKIFFFNKYAPNSFSTALKAIVLMLEPSGPIKTDLMCFSPTILLLTDLRPSIKNFGSGFPEPKFFIENLKPVNSKVVGEKHIKSVLIGPEGSIVKTIAFNAADNELGAYLLKKNNKTFNIAGKLSLNEWRGQKNVEFIIDDISVNKNIKNMVPSSIG